MVPLQEERLRRALALSLTFLDIPGQRRACDARLDAAVCASREEERLRQCVLTFLTMSALSFMPCSVQKPWVDMRYLTGLVLH